MRPILDDWIKVGRDIQGGEIITIKDEGETRENTTFKNPDGTTKLQYVFKVELNGDEKKLTLNKTSLKLIMEKYGPETKEWIGRQLKLNVAKTIQGKNMILAEPI